MTRANIGSVLSDIATFLPGVGRYLSRYFYGGQHRRRGQGIGQIVMVTA